MQHAALKAGEQVVRIGLNAGVELLQRCAVVL